MESRRRVFFVAQMICNFMPSFDGITFFARNFWNDFGSQVPWTYWQFCFFSASQGFCHRNCRDLEIVCYLLFGVCVCVRVIVWSNWYVFLSPMGFHRTLKDLFWPIPIGFEGLQSRTHVVGFDVCSGLPERTDSWILRDNKQLRWLPWTP